MVFAVDQVVSTVHEFTFGVLSPVWDLEPHEDVYPLYTGVHPPP